MGNVNDLVIALNEHSKALDRNSKMSYLHYMALQDRKSDETPVSLRLTTIAPDSSKVRWQQILPRNPKRKEAIISASVGVLSYVAFAQTDTMDPQTLLVPLWNSQESGASSGEVPVAAHIIDTGGITRVGTYKSTDALYVCTFVPLLNVSPPPEGFFINPSTTFMLVTAAEMIYEDVRSVPLPGFDDRPDYGEILKPSREVSAVIGEVESMIGRDRLH